jgi:hypothetical protein
MLLIVKISIGKRRKHLFCSTRTAAERGSQCKGCFNDGEDEDSEWSM